MLNFIRLFFVGVTLIPLGCSAAGSEQFIHKIVNEDEVVVTAVNESDRPFRIWERTMLAGRGGGNVLFFAVNELGQAAVPCAFIDSFAGRGDVKVLDPGETYEIWRGSLRTLSRMHCLESGKYSASFVYRAPGGQLLYTKSFDFVVDESEREKVSRRNIEEGVKD